VSFVSWIDLIHSAAHSQPSLVTHVNSCRHCNAATAAARLARRCYSNVPIGTDCRRRQVARYCGAPVQTRVILRIFQLNYNYLINLSNNHCRNKSLKLQSHKSEPDKIGYRPPGLVHLVQQNG